jgi:hypothetical protein
LLEKVNGRVIDYIEYTVVYANQVEGNRAWAVATGNRVTFTLHVAGCVRIFSSGILSNSISEFRIKEEE